MSIKRMGGWGGGGGGGAILLGPFRGSKISHTGGRCVTCLELTNLAVSICKSTNV